MNITNLGYLPILKWRQGEYQALMRLDDTVKDHVTPLIVIPPIEFDFEQQRPKKTLNEHIEPFSRRLITKWEKRKALIDLHQSLRDIEFSPSLLVIEHIFNELRQADLEHGASPVVRLAMSTEYYSAISRIVTTDKNGAGLRVKLNELMSPSAATDISKALELSGLRESETDLVLDLEAPQNFEPYEIFSNALRAAINRIPNLTNYQSVTIAGTALKLSEIRRPFGEQSRHEWHFYKVLKGLIQTTRSINFGDYTIESPEFIEQDMRLLNPGGKIVYATESSWIVPKGGSFRDNRSQMIDHCNTIIGSGHYKDSEYSHGDKRIQDTATGAEGTGNQTTWKQVGVNHHITLVVDQLSKLPSS